MKRVNENDEGMTKNSGVFKKGRLMNAIDEYDGVSEGTQGEEERVFAENRAIVSAEMDGRRGFADNEVSGDFGNSNLGGLNRAGKSDFDLMFGHSEEDIDLNVPVFQGFTQEGPVIDQRRTEIINLVSDDSDDEVVIVGSIGGTGAKGKQKEIPMSSDSLENLNHGLEINLMDNFVDENGPVTGDERNYAGEEEGMANMENSWLSLNSFYPNDVEVMARQPEALPAIPDQFELELRYEEEASRRRAEATQAILRRTAKRFARPNYLGESSGNRSDQGKNSPGPFAEVLKLVREMTSKGASQDAIEWKPSVQNLDHRISALLVPSLLDLSVKALAENAEGLVSLELVPDMLRRRLTDLLCDTCRMSVHVLNLLVKGYPTEIRIKNCSWLTDKQFHQAFNNCQTKNLMVLQLDLCGQIMLDLAFRDMLSRSSNKFSSLAIISLRGACRLSDSGLKELVLAAPNLLSINLGQCPILTCDSINNIADLLGPNLRELYIDDCPKIDAMLILPAFRKFKCLEVLSVGEIQSVTDEFVSELINSCGHSIKEFDFANCQELTDCSLKTIGSKCVDLRSLNVSYLHNLTDLGMEHLANGCKSMQKLQLCRNGFSDEAIASFLESCGGFLTELSLNNVRKVGPNTAFSLAKCSRKLLSLDLSWCRGITDESVGLIVDSCSSLKLLKVFGCKQITSVFLHGHSNPVVQILGLDLTPILNNLDLLEPEEMLLRYSSPNLRDF
ncbi:DNA repair protein RAD7-like [Primulina tabacum]|uniref:DNA repair protein RAD7-like n=1 Tax=Primulina tabacum TaxID=48773 RepID=UPI003F594922